MTFRLFSKLIVAVLCVLVVALVSVDLLATRLVESTYVDSLRRELAAEARLLSLLGVSSVRVRALSQAARARLTLIAADGSVLADSEGNPEKMENHRDRVEVHEALAGREGWSIRRSPTIGEPFLYVAEPYGQGAVRLAVPLTEVRTQVNVIRKQMLVSTATAFLPAVFVAAFFARWVSAKLAAIIVYAGQLADGNFRARLKEGRDELGTLARKLNETSAKLQRTVEELDREHQELEKLERIRRDFVINVSHELRTPLASIQGYTETLLDGALHDPAHNVRFLSIIRQNSERLGRLIADLMIVSGLELKTRRFRFTFCSVESLLREASDQMHPLAAKKNIRLGVEAVPERAEIYADAEAVNQILGNLLDNAIKYTPDGGAITIGARDANTHFEMYVRDTGIGIAAAELPRLFERFYRVDKARSRELGGTGLGLSIVKHLVRAQGGEVGVDSAAGMGSTFSFTLPKGPPPEPAQREFQDRLTVS